MALATSLLVLIAVALFAWLATSVGHHLLRFWSVDCRDGELLLFSAALGIICLEVLLFLVQTLGHFRLGVFIVGAVAVLFGAADAAPVIRRLRVLLHRIGKASRLETVLSGLVGAVLLLQGIASTAPVTGSDALHYHFTSPLLTLRTGFHPSFFLSHSFFCGQSHLLIQAALALGSSRIAMGLLFLGGVLSALASVSLARQWMDGCWSWTVALVFSVTPVVFWQMSLSGAPDLWMAFFTTMGVLAIFRFGDLRSNSLAILPGALAGAVAGTKYTGCIVALTLAITYSWHVRSFLKTSLFVSSALSAGVWPYLRNLVWTGDPVFPFLTGRLFPDRVNAFALASYLSDTGAGEFKGLWYVIKSIFFAGLDAAHPGFWQYFGPLILVFAPFLILVGRDAPGWRVAIPVWVFSAMGIAATSGMTRFLLPVFPIAIAAAIVGMTYLRPGLARGASICTLVLFILTGATGLLVYERAALAVAAGLIAPETYLLEHSPDYEKVQFVNRALSGRAHEGSVLVFFRHTYYLTVPFLYGDPSASWAVDPHKLQTSNDWRTFLMAQRICWVVCSPDYPAAIAGALGQLEASGELMPIAHGEVRDFQGLRISDDRRQIPIRILELRDSNK